MIIKQNYELIGFLILSNISTHLFMVKCVTTNPGIIPQQVPRRQSHSDNFQIPESRLNQQDCRYLLPNTTLNLYAKYCYECRIFRPPRAIHCAKCNHCVERYDHHCPWLAVCIGRFNYRYFLGYVGSLTVLSWYTFAVCLDAFVNEMRRSARFTSYLAQTLVGLLSLFFALPLLRLLFYHFSIFSQNRTTNEDLKKTFIKHMPLSFPTWPIDRDPFFTQQTQYYMQKSVSFSMGSKHHDSSKMKEIMMASIVRQLNDSTSLSSSSVVMRGQRYSMNTERASVFNYLLQTQHE